MKKGLQQLSKPFYYFAMVKFKVSMVLWSLWSKTSTAR